MSQLFQGQTPANAINLESEEFALKSASTVAYSDEWQRVKTGQELLYVTFPTVLQKGRVKVINGLPTAAKGEPIINVSDISKLVEIPPLETITEARDVLLKANEEAQIQEGPRSSRTPAPWGVQVSNFGSFNANVLSILPKIFDVKNFAELCSVG